MPPKEKDSTEGLSAKTGSPIFMPVMVLFALAFVQVVRNSSQRGLSHASSARLSMYSLSGIRRIVPASIAGAYQKSSSCE